MKKSSKFFDFFQKIENFDKMLEKNRKCWKCFQHFPTFFQHFFEKKSKNSIFFKIYFRQEIIFSMEFLKKVHLLIEENRFKEISERFRQFIDEKTQQLKVLPINCRICGGFGSHLRSGYDIRGSVGILRNS